MTDLEQRVLDSYRAAFTDYEKQVLSGVKKRKGISLCVSATEMAKVLRQQKEVKEGVTGYVFDLEMGLKPLVWMAVNLCFPFGPKRGKALRLQPWQVYDTAVLFGWVKESDHSQRRFMDAFIEVARKNGKSTWAGALLDYLTFGEIEGAQCYIAATSLDQAEETFTRASNCISLRHPDAKVANSKNNKTIKWGSGLVKAIAADPKDGKLAYGAIIDEYHQHKNNDLLNSIHSGNVSDQQSLLIRITTAGTNANGVCHEEYETCKRILNGEVDGKRYFVSIYEPSTSDPIDDPDTWTKANPNWGVSIDLDAFRAMYEYALPSESNLIDFKTKNLNLWSHPLLAWANLPVWFAKCHWSFDYESLPKSTVVYLALDLSRASDFSSVTGCIDIGGRYVEFTKFWIPKNMKETIQRQCNVTLDKWIHEGWVITTPGDIVDYSYIAEYLNELYDRYTIRFVACDRWKLDELIEVMPVWFQECALEFSQYMRSMSPATRDFEREYLQGNITACENPVIDWMLECCDIYQDASGNIKLVKPKDRTGKRIDGIITSIMALDTCKKQSLGSLSDTDVADLVSFF